MKDFEDTLMALTMFNIGTANKKHNDIDNKAIGVITISGLLISFLLGFSQAGGSISTILFIIALFSFMLTIWLSIGVLRPRKSHDLSTLCCINEIEDDDPYKVNHVIGAAAEIEDEIQNICTSKAGGLWNSIRGLTLSVGLLIIYTGAAFIGV
jgi:hypothetical protein